MRKFEKLYDKILEGIRSRWVGGKDSKQKKNPWHETEGTYWKGLTKGREEKEHAGLPSAGHDVKRDGKREPTERGKDLGLRTKGLAGHYGKKLGGRKGWISNARVKKAGLGNLAIQVYDKLRFGYYKHAMGKDLYEGDIEFWDFNDGRNSAGDPVDENFEQVREGTITKDWIPKRPIPDEIKGTHMLMAYIAEVAKKIGSSNERLSPSERREAIEATKKSMGKIRAEKAAAAREAKPEADKEEKEKPKTSRKQEQLKDAITELATKLKMDPEKLTAEQADKLWNKALDLEDENPDFAIITTLFPEDILDVMKK